MISRNLPPVTVSNYSAPAGHAYPGADSEVTPDMIEMGSQLGCPFLASLKKPEFASSGQADNCDGANLCRSNTTAAASAAVAGAFGLAGVAGACPHMSNQPADTSNQPKPPQGWQQQ